MKNIIDAMNWRYATKVYDTSTHISAEDFNTIIEAVRLSPSSFGMPTWQIVSVQDPSLRQKMQEASWGQAQVTDADYIIVFAVKTTIDAAFVDSYIELVATERNVPVESLQGFSSMLKGYLSGKTPEQIQAWATKQAYIALGTLLTTAALLEVDSTPMEGFSPDQIDEILGLSALGLRSVVMATLGKRAASDAYSTHKKVREPLSTFLIRK